MRCDAMRILGFLRARCGREHDAMMLARDLAVDPSRASLGAPCAHGREQQGDTTPASSLAARPPINVHRWTTATRVQARLDT